MAYTQIQKISGVVTNFGKNVVIRGYYAVSADDGGDIYTYKRGIDGVWTQIGVLNTSASSVGDSLDISDEYFVAGAPDVSAGVAVISSLNNPSVSIGIWNAVNFGLSVGDRFGSSVAISDEYILFGASGANSNSGQAHLYMKGTGNTWTAYSGNPITPSLSSANDYFGSAVAISGDSLIIGAYGDSNKKGAVYIFQKDVDTELWEQTQKVFASDGLSNDKFGESISASGDYFVAGASLKDNSVEEVNAGAAYIFKYSTSWYEVDKLIGQDESSYEGNHFGESVYINGDHIIIGSPAARLNKGVADVFYKKRSWGHLKKIVGSDTLADDTFGTSVGVSGRHIVVGSPSEGANGSIYIYEDPPVNLRLAQEFEVGRQFIPSKASVYLKRVGENLSNFWPIYNTTKTVIDATNFSTISSPFDLSSNTIVQYKMNDDLATTNVVDSQGLSNGTYNGANTQDRTTTGKINDALNFTGGTDYIDTNYSFTSVFQDSFTINYWLKADNSATATQNTIFGLSDGSSNFFTSNYRNRDLYYYYRGSDNNGIFTTAIDVFPVGTEGWHMVTVSTENVSATTARSTIYFDGVLVKDSGVVPSDMSTYNQVTDLSIGIFNAATNPLNGSVDNFCIFDKKLTQKEIDFLYNDGTGTEELSNISPTDEILFTLEETDYTSAEIVFEDSLGGFTGNGYMICKEFEGTHHKTLNYPIRAINPDTYDLWIRAINANSNTLEMDILIDGVVSQTISTLIDNPSDGLEWSWVNTTLILPDSKDYTLGIRIKENNVAIDKVYIEVDSTTPYTEGPDYIISPYLTTHMRVYDSLSGEPNSPIPVYDYKNSITEIIQDDWYNFNINALASNQGYITADDFSENYYLVMSTSGTDVSNFITWELVDNDEYSAPASAIKF